MDRLFSPWRYTYVTRDEKKSTGCVFCSALETEDGRALTLLTGTTCFVILNLYPYNSGHLMIVPRRHVGTLAALDDVELAEIGQWTQRAEMALTEAYQPQGINVGMNLGRPAGAGVLDHLHVHVVPRRRKDGLKGFFWPRNKYQNEAEMLRVQEAIQLAITSLT